MTRMSRPEAFRLADAMVPTYRGPRGPISDRVAAHSTLLWLSWLGIANEVIAHDELVAAAARLDALRDGGSDDDVDHEAFIAWGHASRRYGQLVVERGVVSDRREDA